MHGLACQILEDKARIGVGSLLLKCIRQAESTWSLSAVLKPT